MQKEQTVLTTSEVAAELRCSLRTVYRLLQRGDLRGAFYVGGRIRIPVDALTALIDQHPRLAGPEPCEQAGTSQSEREKLSAVAPT